MGSLSLWNAAKFFLAILSTMFSSKIDGSMLDGSVQCSS